MADNTCANPLLLGWIKEWLEQARQRNSKGVTVYKKAYDSMKACPLTFRHPSEAQQLNGLGPKLCERLTARLEEYCEENGLPRPDPPHVAKRPRKPKPYVPTLRSGAYALLVALSSFEERSSAGATKAQLIDAAQPHCDTSFTAPADTTKFYTAWNSMKTLVAKDLVYEHGRPLKRYLLTDQGRETAKLIQKATEMGNPSSRSGNTVIADCRFGQEDPNASRGSLREPQCNSRVSSAITSRNTLSTRRSDILGFCDSDSFLDVTPREKCNPNATRAASRGFDVPRQIASSTSGIPIPLASQDFTVELVLDVREIRTPKDRDYIANELIRKGIQPIVRALELGDALWVAKFKDPDLLAQYGEEGDEIMLDWIVERKRLDDLVGSIKDGRFHEQKFRLRRSGIKNVIYLIEEFAITDSSSASAASTREAVASAIASTQVVNGYFVKRTRNMDDTIRYLARTTSLLRTMFSDPAQSSLCLIPTSSITSVTSYLDILSQFRAEDNVAGLAHSAEKTTTYAVTFSTFSTLSSKSDMLTLRDLFLKMLMCTRGLTGEKALEIQRRWSTPRQFVEALEAADTGGEQGKKKTEELVFSEMGGLVGRKKVGKALSKKIAEVWGKQG
ncbi:conserved hypothetical protein [Uncinocarpus reesii 1704]|uniref:Crossover junction endonuclease MUS81 n=1 Tax=Uncinocarpus reesii (strain UAMH 1704) TaxID=336963 RepID=C4JYK7_UNCRE|nr:uncharacterized protein UREG_07258 [Uncinocarpus reesii 1704]EEP82393.1 conserved hypothetical protein [Uncinocarpus reesii 1704]